MEESSPKADDTGNEDKSPPKKPRFEEQQPSTSSTTSMTISNSPLTSSDTTANEDDRNDASSEGSSDEDTNRESRPGGVVTARTASIRPGVLTARSAVTSAREAAASDPSNRREIDARIRRNVRRLAFASIFGEQENMDDDDFDNLLEDSAGIQEAVDALGRREVVLPANRNVNQLINLIGQPALNNIADFSESSSDASYDADNGAALPLLDDDSDDSSSDMYSGSSSTSSEGSAYSLEDPLPDADDDAASPEVNDMNDLDCLKMDKLKGNWNILRDIRQRQQGLPVRASVASIGGTNPGQFQKRAYGSVNFVQRLGLLHRLEEHSGCVNSLSFNSSGKLLASGSDDLHVNLWHWESKKLLKSIANGHRSNVFQTKFMEYNGYENELEIISTGRDGQVRHTRIDPSGRVSTNMLFRGHKPIHKIAIPARKDSSFMTAGEDGKVRLYDLRQGKLETLKKLSKPMYSIATHPYDPEFCVAGSDTVVRVYDMRNLQETVKAFSSQQHAAFPQSVTCAVYNDSGTEVLASFSDDDIYLYDNTSSERMNKPISRFQGHCNIETIKGVNFFGPRSEYVVSGSDCGFIYVWDKRTRIIVNWLHGDRMGAVNCLEPHPEFPILATSGVDNDIKIWVPQGLNDEQAVPLFAPQDLRRSVRRNVLQRRDTVIMSRMRRLAHETPYLSEYLQARGNGNRARAAANDNANANANANSDSDSDLIDADFRMLDDARHMLRCNPS